MRRDAERNDPVPADGRRPMARRRGGDARWRSGPTRRVTRLGGASPLKRLSAVGLVGLVVWGAVACGDDGDDRSGSFCEDGAAGLVALTAVGVDPGDDEFAAIVDRLEDVRPPESLADEWDAVVEALVGVRDQDPGDPAGVAEAQGRFMERHDDLRQIEEYIRTTCAGR